MVQDPANIEPQPEGFALEEQLVAYLDGELSPEEGRRIEALLASDAEVRLKLQGLERSWELLDQLVPTPVDDAFTRSTMEMVAVAAAAEAELSQAALPRLRRRRWLLATTGLLTTLVLGFAAGWLLWSDADRPLLDDLTVLEHLDEYRQVQDFRFLKRLAEERLFSDERTEEGKP
jgi:anti-sigma-K factor RskA